jgi:hypothetical protein
MQQNSYRNRDPKSQIHNTSKFDQNTPTPLKEEIGKQVVNEAHTKVKKSIENPEMCIKDIEMNSRLKDFLETEMLGDTDTENLPVVLSSSAKSHAKTEIVRPNE